MRILLLLALVLAVVHGSEPLRIAALGDSLTGDRPGKPYLHAYLKWIDLVALGVQARGHEAEAINAGWGGGTTRGVASKGEPGALARLQADVIDRRPGICVVMIGGNNFARVKTEDPASATVAAVRAAYREDLVAIVDRLQAAGIRTLLLQYPQARAKDPATAWVHLAWGNPVVAEVATAKGLPVLDLEPAFAAALAAGAAPAELLNEKDGVHLNARGELVVARAVTARLVDLGWVR
jgi:lysophospholipase L1-like esterase